MEKKCNEATTNATERWVSSHAGSMGKTLLARTQNPTVINNKEKINWITTF